jgi:hypothetical protein
MHYKEKKLSSIQNTVMSNIVKNIYLYIKRCEVSSANEEYVRNAFESNSYGKVSYTKFIEKSNSNTGEVYYGVIVGFNQWFQNDRVRKLFNDLETNEHGTAKIFHDRIGQKYWLVNEFKQKLEEDAVEDTTALVDDNLSDKEKIKALEKLARSLLVQMDHLQKTCEINEQKIMSYEETQRHDYIQNMGIRFNLEDKEQELQEKNQELQEKNQQLEELKMSNVLMQLKI